MDEAKVVEKVVKRLRKIREERGISVYRISKDTGLSASGIRHMEKGDVTPTLFFLLRISAYLEVDFAAILTEVNSNSSKK